MASRIPPSFIHTKEFNRARQAIRRANEAGRRLAEEADDAEELSPAAYLRDLAERLMRVPVIHGVDGHDIDRLAQIAREIEGR